MLTLNCIGQSDLFYINSYRNIVWPAPNMSYLGSLARAQTLIYSCGSLYTSIIPSLALRGVAAAIASSPMLRYKVLLLNTSNDRETPDYTAVDFIEAISHALIMSDSPAGHDGVSESPYCASDFITHVVYHRSGQLTLDLSKVQGLGIEAVAVGDGSAEQTSKKTPRFTEADVREALAKITSSRPSRSRRSSVASMTAGSLEPDGQQMAHATRHMEGFTYLPLQ